MVDAVVAARRRAAAVIGRLMFGVVHSFSCHAVERRSVVAAKRTHAEMRVQAQGRQVRGVAGSRRRNASPHDPDRPMTRTMTMVAWRRGRHGAEV